MLEIKIDGFDDPLWVDYKYNPGCKAKVSRYEVLPMEPDEDDEVEEVTIRFSADGADASDILRQSLIDDVGERCLEYERDRRELGEVD
jgi:hypothetical protein